LLLISSALGATVFNIPFEIIVLIIWLLLGKLVGFLVLRQIKAFNEIDIYLRTLPLIHF
jgi:hypothetical protein